MCQYCSHFSPFHIENEKRSKALFECQWNKLKPTIQEFSLSTISKTRSNEMIVRIVDLLIESERGFEKAVLNTNLSIENWKHSWCWNPKDAKFVNRKEFCLYKKGLIKKHLQNINWEKPWMSFDNLTLIITFLESEKALALKKTQFQLYNELIESFIWCLYEEMTSCLFDANLLSCGPNVKKSECCF